MSKKKPNLVFKLDNEESKQEERY